MAHDLVALTLADLVAIRIELHRATLDHQAFRQAEFTHDWRSSHEPEYARQYGVRLVKLQEKIDRAIEARHLGT